MAALVAALVLLLAFGSYPFDEQLRAKLQARMNQNLQGYTLSLGHAHASLLGLSLTLRDVVMRQQANPEPPVAKIPRLHLSVEWPELLSRHLVGDAVFDRPSLHLNVPQLHVEEQKRIRLGQRGWQKALESVYPLKFNSFRVNEGSIVYVDGDPQRPLEISHWTLRATNVRNLHYPDRVYPSPFHADGAIFGTGRGVIEGNANFLSEPFPGIRARYRVVKVPLDRLQQFKDRSSVELRQGLLSSMGAVEYAPRVKVVDVADLLLEGVRLDYVHAAATAEAERQRGKALAAAAKQAEESPVVMRLDRLRLTGGSVGFVNRETQPPYRLYVEHADLDMEHISNRAAQLRGQPAVARLRGRFMGGGSARASATFRPGEPNTELRGELAVEKTSLPALNDFLLAYKKIDVAAGTVSIYMQVTVKNGQLQGYIKTMFDDVKVYDPRKDRGKPLGTRLKEKVLGGLAHLLENKRTDALATRTELTGTVGSPRTNTGQILSGLIRNAFFKAIVPGFDNATRQRGKR
ncbi:MAG TPA: DUF748 domain-containing protein [Thermoanaerobaculia bacterium]|nr:DUF748 domain-containing protein [Thermoanaerobaculia bacterium]